MALLISQNEILLIIISTQQVTLTIIEKSNGRKPYIVQKYFDRKSPLQYWSIVIIYYN